MHVCLGREKGFQGCEVITLSRVFFCRGTLGKGMMLPGITIASKVDKMYLFTCWVGNTACTLHPLCQPSLVLQPLTDSGRSRANTKGLGFSLHSSDFCHDQIKGIPDIHQWIGQSFLLSETVSHRDIPKTTLFFLVLISQKGKHSTGTDTISSETGPLWLVSHIEHSQSQC